MALNTCARTPVFEVNIQTEISFIVDLFKAFSVRTWLKIIMKRFKSNHLKRQNSIEEDETKDEFRISMSDIDWIVFILISQCAVLLLVGQIYFSLNFCNNH